jgi:glyoxylase-like metal-dependent hydrolase (beta-lactamase superfamily II)
MLCIEHIAYFHDGSAPVVFCSDTLFAGGCGSVFEGTFPMMLNSLESLAALPSARNAPGVEIPGQVAGGDSRASIRYSAGLER